MIPLPAEPRRILIIKPSALGDIVHTLPILRLLRKRFVRAHIAWLINPPFVNLIENHRDLDEAIPFQRKHFAKSWHDINAAASLLEFKSNLRGRRFDLVIDLQGLFRSAWLAWYTRAPVRVGFGNAREMAQFFYTHRVPVRDAQVHAIERYLTLIEALGCEREPIEFDFSITDADRQSILPAIDGRRLAVLLPGTNWPTKRWPAESFAKLVPVLKERFGLDSIVAGAADTPVIDGAIDLTGKTTLKQLVALLERAAVVIANDTGPMHIAAALRRPLVSLFGPTNPIRTGPFQRMDTVVRLNLPCSPCYSRSCSHQSCMRWMTTDMVVAAVERVL